MKTTTKLALTTRLYGVYFPARNHIRWVLARDEEEAMKTAKDRPENVVRIVGKFDPAMATKPRELKAAEEIIGRKLEEEK